MRSSVDICLVIQQQVKQNKLFWLCGRDVDKWQMDSQKLSSRKHVMELSVKKVHPIILHLPE